MIVAYIDSHRERFGVEPICAELSQHGITIAPSTYYAHQACPVSPAALEEAYLANALVTLHWENWGVYGVRKLWHAARRAGLDVGRDQVGRLMRIAGITGAVRGRHTMNRPGFSGESGGLPRRSSGKGCGQRSRRFRTRPVGCRRTSCAGVAGCTSRPISGLRTRRAPVIAKARGGG